MVVHCLFEQSGTFKNEFKKLGYEAYDYDIPAESGTYVLRTRSYHDLALKVNDLQDRLYKRDLIKLYIIGYRPDNPIPAGRLFTEAMVDIGGAQEWQSTFGRWYVGAYHRIATGMKEDTDVNVKS